MITLGARRQPPRPTAADQWHDDASQRAVYFTDGVDLYRVVRWLARPHQPRLAEVENCRSLDTTLLSCDDLASLAVRLVPVAATIEAAATAGLLV
jgi:hypothetical protein